MRKRVVDPIILEKLLREGLSQREIAGRFHVGEAAISKNVKALTFCKSQDVVLRSAQKIADKKLNAMGRLERVINRIETELNYIEKTMKKSSGPERREWEKTHLGYNAEVRKQISLLREIALTLYNVEETEAFKKIILEELGNESEELRDRVLERIKQRRASTGLPAIGGLGI